MDFGGASMPSEIKIASYKNCSVTDTLVWYFPYCIVYI